MDVILVHWRIRADAEDDFLREHQPFAEGTVGLVREDLYRGTTNDPDVVSFLRIGRWETQRDFERAILALGLTPGEPPPPKPYEVAQRCREWLTFDREDYPCADGPSGQGR